MIKDDPLYLRSISAMLLFFIMLPLIVTIMSVTLLGDILKRRKMDKKKGDV
jgi:hypothetical protein